MSRYVKDVTAGYSKPCVIDLKVGLRTYSQRGHDEAYIAKRCVHDERSGQAEVGFKVCGMQTWERRLDGGDYFAGDYSVSAAIVDEMTAAAAAASGGGGIIGGGGGGGGGVGGGGAVAAGGMLVGDGVVDHGDGWLQRRRPYEWARNLCSKEHVRAALEEFVAPTHRHRHRRRNDAPLSSVSAATCTSVSSDDGSFVSGDENNPAAAVWGNKDDDTAAAAAAAAETKVKNHGRSVDSKHASSSSSSSSSAAAAAAASNSARAAEVFGEALEHLRGLRRWFATQREVHLLARILSIFTCPTTFVSTHVVHRSIHRSIRWSTHRSIHWSTHRSIHRSTHRSAHHTVKPPSLVCFNRGRLFARVFALNLAQLKA